MLPVWPSEDVVDLGLVDAQAVGVPKTVMAEGCLIIGGRATVQRLVELLGCMVVGRKVLGG